MDNTAYISVYKVAILTQISIPCCRSNILIIQLLTGSVLKQTKKDKLLNLALEEENPSVD